MIDYADKVIAIIPWVLFALVYLFCAFAVTYAMLRENAPPMIIINGRDPKKPVGNLGAILHGLFWPIVFTIKLLTREKK